ncbi:MAG: hypothetical protein IKL90_00345 [Alphaproteobacteria bacterium]|nr:hypothetical protein [Alphaproteobacteria bacterium]
MKKYALLILLFGLSACSSTHVPYCEEYIYKTPQSTTKLFFKDGAFQKETLLKNKSFTQEGLYIYEPSTLHLFSKNKKETYTLENKKLISIQSQEKVFKCH